MHLPMSFHRWMLGQMETMIFIKFMKGRYFTAWQLNVIVVVNNKHHFKSVVWYPRGGIMWTFCDTTSFHNIVWYFNVLSLLGYVPRTTVFVTMIAIRSIVRLDKRTHLKLLLKVVTGALIYFERLMLSSVCNYSNRLRLNNRIKPVVYCHRFS